MLMDYTKIKPLASRVLIKKSQAPTAKKGILLPETAQEKPKEGEVVAVGPGSLDKKGNLIKMGVKKGDKVLFSSYSGTEVPSLEEEYMILSEEDILAIIN